jgi:hypothetical protein
LDSPGGQARLILGAYDFNNCANSRRQSRQYAANPTLGQWVSTQRRFYRLHQEGKPSPMTAERIRELASIGFDWGPSKTN